MRGRKNLPTVLKLLKGNPGHRPPPEDEPKPEPNIPKCPKHLDKEARQEWNRMVKELESLGMLTNLDKAVFALYCQTYSTWAQASRQIQEKGMVFTTAPSTRTLKDGSVKVSGGGLPIVNPYFSIADKAKEQMMKALIEMGMTPSSRSRVKATPPPKEAENKKERFFSK